MTDNEAADLVDTLNDYYDIMRTMEEKGFHLQGVQLLTKMVRITFEAKEIKASFWKQDLEKVSQLEIEVTFDELDDMVFPEVRLTFSLPRKGRKNE
jgi:septation ring formation regulator EzrA